MRIKNKTGRTCRKIHTGGDDKQVIFVIWPKYFFLVHVKQFQVMPTFKSSVLDSVLEDLFNQPQLAHC